MILGAFNGQVFIEEQLATIVAQTLPPVEIVAGDDASTDGTVRAGERLAATSDVPICILRRTSKVGFAGMGNSCSSTVMACLPH